MYPNIHCSTTNHRQDMEADLPVSVWESPVKAQVPRQQ